jgi:hypothetical protein
MYIRSYPISVELLQKVFESIREHGMSEGKHLSQNERSLLDAFQTSAKKLLTWIPVSGPVRQFLSDHRAVYRLRYQDGIFQCRAQASLIPLISGAPYLFMIKHVKDMPATIDRLATLMVKA